jgi:hypothetical protein
MLSSFCYAKRVWEDHQGERQRKEKRIGRERGSRAHPRRRNRVRMPAEVRHSDEKSERPGDALGREKGRGDRGEGGFIGMHWSGGGARV